MTKINVATNEADPAAIMAHEIRPVVYFLTDEDAGVTLARYFARQNQVFLGPELDRVSNLSTGLNLSHLHASIERMAADYDRRELPADKVLAFGLAFFAAHALPDECEMAAMPTKLRFFDAVTATVYNCLLKPAFRPQELPPLPQSALHALLDIAQRAVNGANEEDLRASVLAEVIDRFASSLATAASGLTFLHLRMMLQQIESELASAHSKPALAPLAVLDQILTPAEVRLIAEAYDQPGRLTISALLSIINRMDCQIASVPNGSSPIRSLLLRMDEVAKNIALKA